MTVMRVPGSSFTPNRFASWPSSAASDLQHTPLWRPCSRPCRTCWLGIDLRQGGKSVGRYDVTHAGPYFDLDFHWGK